MPVKVEKIVVWDDFSGGEYGDLPAHNVAPNQWTGLNVLVYRNGEIGPRPGLRTFVNTSLPNGVIKGMGFSGTPGSEFWVAFNSVVETYDSTAGPAWVPGTNSFASATVAEIIGVETSPGVSYIINPTNELTKATHASGSMTLTAVTDHDGVTTNLERSMAVYRDRLYTSDSQSIRYSAPGDFDTWAAVDSFTVGHGLGIRFMAAKGDALIIITADSSIWEYRGVPGADSLKRVYNGTRHPWVFMPGRAIVLPNDDMIMVPVQRDYPAIYSGGRLLELRHLKMLNGGEGVGVADADEWDIIETTQDDGCLITSNLKLAAKSRSLERKDGLWYIHEWAVSLVSIMATDKQHRVLLTDGGASGTPAVFYTYDASLERMGYTDDSFSEPGDDSQNVAVLAQFSTGEWWADEGQEVSINRIIVDHTQHNTGGSQNIHFDLDVIMSGIGNASGTTTIAMADLDVAQTGNTGDTSRERYISGTPAGGSIWGAGFQVKFSNIRKLGISQIRVEISQRPITPRY